VRSSPPTEVHSEVLAAVEAAVEVLCLLIFNPFIPAASRELSPATEASTGCRAPADNPVAFCLLPHIGFTDYEAAVCISLLSGHAIIVIEIEITKRRVHEHL
jgi:hypothetical protein